MTRHILLAAGLGLLLNTGSQDPGTKELARFEGVWSFAVVEVNGEKQPAVPFATNKLVILKDGRFCIVQGPRVTRGTLKLDPTKTPKHYDVMHTQSAAKGQTALGIYELEGDSLKVCFQLKGKDRPAGFSNQEGSDLLSFAFQREKQPVSEALIEIGRVELAGSWQALSYALDGQRASDEDMKKIQLVFDSKGNTKAINDGKIFIAATTKIDPAKNPMTIDMVYTEGDQKGQTSLGIYKIEDDLLTICRAPRDKARPTEFSSAPGSGNTLMSYKREPTAPKLRRGRSHELARTN
jgi:uncharacterized protein (TIGR03067 family)